MNQASYKVKKVPLDMDDGYPVVYVLTKRNIKTNDAFPLCVFANYEEAYDEFKTYPEDSMYSYAIIDVPFTY